MATGNWVRALARVLVGSVTAAIFLAGPVWADLQPLKNPSFEVDAAFLDLSISDARDWTDNVGTLFGGATPDETRDPVLITDGLFGACLRSLEEVTYEPGDEVHLAQVVDLTKVAAIQFDAQLVGVQPGGVVVEWDEVFEATVRINGVVVWSSQAAGTYMDQAVDTSSLTGARTLEFRLEAVAALAEPGQMNCFQFDDLEAVPLYLDGDLDQDGSVGIMDLALLLSAYNSCDGDRGFFEEADITGDGCVDCSDLSALLGNYGLP